MKSRTSVLVLLRNYLPGYQSGGPVRTIANLVERLGDEFSFRVITSDRDALDDQPYPGINVNGWNPVGKADVYYTSPANQSFQKLSKLIATTPHDVLYLNSCFHATYSVRPLAARRLGLLPRRPVILAPRGELSTGTLKLKAWKKAPYLTAASLLGLYKDLVWQASSDFEVEDIRRMCGSVARRIVIAPNLSRQNVATDSRDASRRSGEPLRVLFLSRITPAKNLTFALKVLAKVRASVSFDIYGPVRDEAYWQTCQRLIANLPPHVVAHYHGAVPPDDVDQLLRTHDLFLLPSLSENFGHAIAEALKVGIPVLISDTTPWRGLDGAGAGWDLPLSDEDRFAACIDRSAGLSVSDYAAWRERVRRYAADRIGDDQAADANRRLFQSVASTT